MSHKHRVVAGVLYRDGAILLGLRSASRRWYPGVWDLPGGHVEPGESTVVALARELREELGIEAVVDPVVVFHIDAEDMDLDAHLVTEWSGDVTNCAPDEHDEVRFVGVHEFERLRFAHPLYPNLLANLISARRQQRAVR